MAVSLLAVVDEMEMASGEEGLHSFLNRQTAEIYGMAPANLLAIAEESDDDEGLLDWEAEIVARFREILDSPDWLKLPRRDPHEDFEYMEHFCFECTHGVLQTQVLAAITCRGAFGRFRDAIYRLGIQAAWYSFRRKCLATKARTWLEANEISFIE